MKAKFRLPWKNQLSQNDFDFFEIKLDAALTPIKPSATFVENLEKKLMSAPISEEQTTRIGLPESKGFRYLLVGGISVLSGTVLLITIVRGILAIRGMLGLAQEARKKSFRTQTA